MKVLETIKTPKGTLLSKLSIAAVRHVQAHGPCNVNNVAQGLGYGKDADLTNLRARLRNLCEGHHIHRVVIGNAIHFCPGPDPEPVEPAPAVQLNIAPPRRINVMAGVYKPEPGQMLRPGADHRHIPSRGHRC